jgi:mRNA interferase RelE/StbE
MGRGQEKAWAVSPYEIFISPTALDMLESIKDRRIRRKLAEHIDGLRLEPEKQGKALHGDLAGLRSVRAVGQRYRIIYRVREVEVFVYVLAVGMRKEGDKSDFYAISKHWKD